MIYTKFRNAKAASVPRYDANIRVQKSLAALKD